MSERKRSHSALALATPMIEPMLHCTRESRRPEPTGYPAAAQDTTMQHRDALQKLRRLFGKSATDRPFAPDEMSLSGPSLLQQEPDLIKEAGRHTLDASGWAAGGQPTE